MKDAAMDNSLKGLVHLEINQSKLKSKLRDRTPCQHKAAWARDFKKEHQDGAMVILLKGLVQSKSVS